MSDPFAGFPLQERVLAAARKHGLQLNDETMNFLAEHARAVLAENDLLHLTTITDPSAFVARHIEESFAGAALLPETIEGELLDLGSGNGYPGVVVAAARDLTPVLAEARKKKAEFLSRVTKAEVLDGQIQRAADVSGRSFAVITARALGSWEKILPRMVPALAEGGRIVVWAGEDVEAIFKREVWRKLQRVASERGIHVFAA